MLVRDSGTLQPYNRFEGTAMNLSLNYAVHHTRPQTGQILTDAFDSANLKMDVSDVHPEQHGKNLN